MFGQERAQQYKQQKGLFTFYREMHQAIQQQQLGQKSIKHFKRSKKSSKLNNHKKQQKNNKKNLIKQAFQKKDTFKSQSKRDERVNNKAEFLKHIVSYNNQFNRIKPRQVLVSSKDNLKISQTEQNPEQQADYLYSLRQQQNLIASIKNQQKKENRQELIKIISRNIKQSFMNKYERNQMINEQQSLITDGNEFILNSMDLAKAKSINKLSIFVQQDKLSYQIKPKINKTVKVSSKIQYPTSHSHLGDINDLIIANQLKYSQEKRKKSNSPDLKTIAKQSIRFPNLHKKKLIKSSLSKQIQNIKQINVTKLENENQKEIRSKNLQNQTLETKKKAKSAKSILKMLPLLAPKQKTQQNQIKIQKPATSLFFCQYVKQQDYNRFNNLTPKKRMLMKRFGFNFNI